MLIGAALYVDVLKSPSCLSVCLQDDHLDIVGGIKAILKASKFIKSMAEHAATAIGLVLSRHADLVLLSDRH